MKKIQMLKNAVSRATGRGGLVLKKFSPEILIGVGVVGVVATVVIACKATLKVEGVLENANAKMDKIHQADETIDKAEYTEQDIKKDLLVVKVQTGVEVAKLYAPAVFIGAVSIGCLMGSHIIMQKRNLAVVAAYKAVEQSFADYRKRVVDQFGSEQDRLLKNGIIQTEITTVEVDEDGKKVKSKKIVESIDAAGASQYARFFDEASAQWSKTSEYNLMFLKAQQNYANDLLQSRGHVFLNEVYDIIGVDRSQAGAVVGWVKGAGDDFVDFGIFNGESDAARAFVNGYERSILLDFNVDGIIYDLI